MTQIHLYFRSSSGTAPALIEVAFRRHSDGPTIRTVRGKFCYVIPAGGSFQWTRAVKAVTVLLLRGALYGDNASIHGEAGSLTASLDYALSKEPTWLSEMFGADSQGRAFARRLFQRTNPERKRAGPVLISINPHIMPASGIFVYLDGARVTDHASLDFVLTQLNDSESGEVRGESFVPGALAAAPLRDTSDRFLLAVADLLERGSPSRALSLDVSENELVTTFASLAEADTFLPSLMDLCTSEARGASMYWYLHHAWWPLISPLYCFKHTEASKSVHTNITYLSPASGITDRYVSNFYANSGISSRLGSAAFLEHDTWFFKDYVIEQVFPGELRGEIDLFLSQTERLDSFNPVSFIRNFLEADATIKLRVRKVDNRDALRASFAEAVRW